MSVEVVHLQESYTWGSGGPYTSTLGCGGGVPVTFTVEKVSGTSPQ